MASQSQDKTENIIFVCARVRLTDLSKAWIDTLPDHEKQRVLSMVGEIFTVEEIDKNGGAWISKSWPAGKEGHTYSHSLALKSHEIALQKKKWSQRVGAQTATNGECFSR